MAERQASSESYCEVCGIDVKHDSELKRFGKFFCTKEHMEAYVKSKQRELGLDEQDHPNKRERRWLGGC